MTFGFLICKSLAARSLPLLIIFLGFIPAFCPPSYSQLDKQYQDQVKKEKAREAWNKFAWDNAQFATRIDHRSRTFVYQGKVYSAYRTKAICENNPERTVVKYRDSEYLGDIKRERITRAGQGDKYVSYTRVEGNEIVSYDRLVTRGGYKYPIQRTILGIRLKVLLDSPDFQRELQTVYYIEGTACR